MIQAGSERKLDSVEFALERAAERHGAHVTGATHFAPYLPKPAEDAWSFSISVPEHDAVLLEAELRMAAFLPWRVAAYTHGGRTVLEAASPVELCGLLGRLDLAPLAQPIDDALGAIMQDAAQPALVRAASGEREGLGATEEQVSRDKTVPQRIDARGTKVEDLGGTGEHDAQGG